MREIYRLLRLRGDSGPKALFVAIVLPLSGYGPWARYHLMQQRLDAMSDES